MSAWSKSRQILVFAAGSVSGIAGYYFLSQQDGKSGQRKKEVFNSWTTNYEPSKCGKWDDNWDHRDPKSMLKPLKKNATPEDDNEYNEKLAKLKPSAVRHIIMIRHGQYYLKGKNDSQLVLTEVGREQAKFTGERLKLLGLPFDDIVQSSMTRAMETATIINKELGEELPVSTCHLLREGAPIPPEPAVGHWRPEASQFFQDGARIEAAFRKYFHRADPEQKEDSYTLLVCHANVIRYFVCRALQFPAEAWLRLALNHASITWMSVTPSGRVVLRTYGDAGHMPPNYVTSANTNSSKP